VYYINIPWQQEQELGLDHDHGLGHALYLELVELKGFQVQEEEKEGHVDPVLGRQLEDVQVDWDTGENIIRLCKRCPDTLYQHTIAAGAGAWP